MKISVERQDWTVRKPDLVLMVGDPHTDTIGETPESVARRIAQLEQGYTEKKLSREYHFTADWTEHDRFECVYFHTSMHEGFTFSETLKTVLASGLRLAAQTGRKSVAFLLKGPGGEGLVEQLVEGALVGTWAFREYKKDQTDPYQDMELILCLPSPPTLVPEPAIEVAAAENTATKATLAIEESDLPEEVQQEVEAAEEEPAAETVAEEPLETEAVAEDAESTEAAEVETVEVPSEESSEQAESGSEEAEAPEPVVDQEALATLTAADESALVVGRAFAEGVNLARDLIARPAADCTPDSLSKTCKKVASTYGFSYQSFGPKQLETHGYAGLVAVGKGADNSPRLVEMTYTPEQDSNVHLVLLGKGVTFDSGGISIKGAKDMHLMVGDMSGAAAVIGAMEVLGKLKPAIKVTAIIVSAENKPGSKSFRPGDIIRYKNGTSVHVENTDAEGRLILADGLIRAGELGATHIVDLATLTGACARALGPSFTGILGANRKLVNAITRAGGNHGESYWRLPMPIEYKDMLKSVHADLNNVGGPEAGATTAALFLKEFVPPRVAWVHLDIAGTFWKQKSWKYYCEGPSGTGVKTVADLALRWAEHLE